MPRNEKKRRVCRLPRCCSFQARDFDGEHGLRLFVEEYEVIRLIDYMGMTQEEASHQMQVSRATIQSIYAEARKKLARFLVEGSALQIAGGAFVLCKESDRQADSACHARENRPIPDVDAISGQDQIKQAGCDHALCVGTGFAGMEKNMKIAVTYENGEVFQHFGHTEQFKVYEVEDGKVVKSEIVGTNGQGHGALAGFLLHGGVDVLICGGIGGGARNALAEAGIQLYPGAQGNADEQVASFLAGSLNYDPNTSCSHHSHAEGESCGDHGNHSCGHHGDHTCGH